ncbi:Uncharacterised protein [Mycobacteroides abscessus subsp. massiliense]|uniref:hypothetical protein n=1 Tax=Mycobacteroides abscessus TaxID=36809 RepID=UPI0009CEF6F1|nr:hypothetical protein [Mycobacteroides abscessus]SKU62251.1 Uncharacterised protein [Mycobacteroides abscessus subsp. massiliense]SKU82507.1 Uncharacterised protein [Mycobacteroides abscessus subsp. massiliense]
MQHNEFNRVIDQIDALVDEQMAGGEYAAISRAEAVVTGVDRCALCGGDWHGSPWAGVDHNHLGEYDRHNHGRSMGCPGAFATGPQRIRYRWHKRQRSAMQGWMGRGHLDDGSRVFARPMGPRGGELRGPNTGIGDSVMARLDEPYADASMAPTVQRIYMVRSPSGRHQIDHHDGYTLTQLWGAPWVPATWWEATNQVWETIEVEETRERPDELRGPYAHLGPMRKTFIELVSTTGVRINPIGVIAWCVGNEAKRVFVQSFWPTPVAYDDRREPLPARSQPLWHAAGSDPHALVEQIITTDAAGTPFGVPRLGRSLTAQAARDAALSAPLLANGDDL